MKEELHIYLRVSSETQISDGFGIDNQKELGLKVSKLKGMKPILHNEGSQSSHNDNIDNRPILRDLLLLIEEGKVKNLWVYQMDRLSRNDVVSFTIRRKLIDHSVKLFVSDTNEYSLDNSTDKLMFRIMEGISEFDNSIRSERLRRGRLSSVKVGGWKGGPPPDGYQLKDKRLVVHPNEIQWVKKIYEHYSDGMSIYEIKKLLMKNGVLSRRGNLIWSDQSIKKILENTHFEGYYYYTDKSLDETVKVECPKTLPSTLIKKVRDRLGERSYTSNYTKYVTLLRDHLVCGHCGSKFGQKVNKTQYYNHYYCRGNSERLRVNGLDERVCVSDNGVRVRSLIIEDVDKLVWDNVIDVISKSTVFKEHFKSEVMDVQTSFGKSMNERKTIRRNIKKVEKTIGEINDTINSLIVDGVTDRNTKEVKPLIKKFELKKLELETQKDDLLESLTHNKQNTIWYDWIKDFGDKIKNLKTNEMSVEDKKKFLDGIVDQIVVKTKDKQTHTIEVKFNSPYVGDSLEWNNKGSPKDGYSIIEGKKHFICEIDTSNKRTKKKTIETIV